MAQIDDFFMYENRVEGITDMQLSTFMLIANALGLRFSLVIG